VNLNGILERECIFLLKNSAHRAHPDGGNPNMAEFRAKPGTVLGILKRQIKPWPSAFGRNLQCQPVRKWTPERHAIGHTHSRASRGAKA
jgi:hypothetical protein